MALGERRDALLVERRVVRYEVGGDFHDVGPLCRIVERRREDAVERREVVAARIQNHATLDPALARERLRRIERPRSRAYDGAEVREVLFPQTFQKPNRANPDLVQKIARRLRKPALELHRNQLEIKSERAGERLGLVFVSGLAVRKYDCLVLHLQNERRLFRNDIERVEIDNSLVYALDGAG